MKLWCLGAGEALAPMPRAVRRVIVAPGNDFSDNRVVRYDDLHA